MDEEKKLYSTSGLRVDLVKQVIWFEKLPDKELCLSSSAFLYEVYKNQRELLMKIRDSANRMYISSFGNVNVMNLLPVHNIIEDFPCMVDCFIEDACNTFNRTASYPLKDFIKKLMKSIEKGIDKFIVEWIHSCVKNLFEFELEYGHETGIYAIKCNLLSDKYNDEERTDHYYGRLYIPYYMTEWMEPGNKSFDYIQKAIVHSRKMFLYNLGYENLAYIEKNYDTLSGYIDKVFDQYKWCMASELEKLKARIYELGKTDYEARGISAYVGDIKGPIYTTDINNRPDGGFCIQVPLINCSDMPRNMIFIFIDAHKKEFNTLVKNYVRGIDSAYFKKITRKKPKCKRCLLTYDNVIEYFFE